MSVTTEDKANGNCENGVGVGSCTSSCAPSTFSCISDLSHKPVTLLSCSSPQEGTNISKPADVGGRRKRCVWFSRDYGQPIFAMHSNCYLNSECFIIDTEISALRILPTYTLLLYKEYIHAIEDDETKFSLRFKDGSDSFAIWIQICSFQNVEPFSTTSVQLTKTSNAVAMEKHQLRSSLSSGPTPASAWLTMKFKPILSSGNQASNWFTFAKMQLVSMSFKKGQYLVLLLKSDDPDDDAPPGLFCVRPGVTCLKTGSQLYYEPCDSGQRKYILDFDNEPLCEHIWNFAQLVTLRNYEFSNNHLQLDTHLLSVKAKRIYDTQEIKRNRRLRLIYVCFRQMHQEVKQIMKSSKSSLQEIIDMPEIHINKLFFSVPTWTERYLSLNCKVNKKLGRITLSNEIKSSFGLQCTNAKLHVKIVKMLMQENVPAEVIAEYRESLVKRMLSKKGAPRCWRIHCRFL